MSDKEYKYKCDRCSKLFYHKADYNKHKNRKNPCEIDLKKIVPNNDSLFGCPDCKCKFVSRSNLKRHIKGSCTRKNFDGTGDLEPTNNIDSAITINTNTNNHIIKYDQKHDDKIQEQNGCEISSLNHKNKLKCALCDKLFTKKSNLEDHKKYRCKFRKELDKSVMNKIYELEKTITELRNKLDNPVVIKNTENSNNNINSNNTSINNQYDIKIIAFGEENLYERISDEIAKKYIDNGYQSVLQLIDYVHFNDEFPELQNVFISNTKDPYAHIFNGIRWEKKQQYEVIDQLFDDKQCFLIAVYNEIKNSLEPKTRIKFERFKNETDKNTIDKLKHEIKLYLYNNRKEPMNRMKSMTSKK